jgi:hypothetical protein
MSNSEGLIKEVRLQLQSIAELLHELDEYLRQFQIARQVMTAEAPHNPAADYPVQTDTTDPRQPYLAGRQPRRDGDSYGTVVTPTTGGAHGQAVDPTGEGQRQRQAAREETGRDNPGAI